MLQVPFIRLNSDLVKERLALKNFKEINLVDEILALDDDRKKKQHEFETTQSKVNSTSKDIGQLMAKGQKAEADAKKAEVAALKATLQPVTESLNEIEKKLQEEMNKK